MSSKDYLWEKVYTTVDCLASGTGTFEERIHNAYLSALMRLNVNDAPKELEDDLAWVLDICQKHNSPEAMAPFTEIERSEIVSKLLNLLVETSS